MSHTDIDPDVMRLVDTSSKGRKHYGALMGFVFVNLSIVAVSGFCTWFASDRIKEVNGPMAGVMMLSISVIIAIFGAYLMRIVNDTRKTLFYKGILIGGMVGAGLSAVVIAITMVYRDQSGGQSFNGIEAMMVLGLLTGACLLAEIFAVHNLGGMKNSRLK